MLWISCPNFLTCVTPIDPVRSILAFVMRQSWMPGRVLRNGSYRAWIRLLCIPEPPRCYFSGICKTWHASAHCSSNLRKDRHSEMISCLFMAKNRKKKMISMVQLLKTNSKAPVALCVCSANPWKFCLIRFLKPLYEAFVKSREKLFLKITID